MNGASLSQLSRLSRQPTDQSYSRTIRSPRHDPVYAPDFWRVPSFHSRRQVHCLR